jgi:hypothetical protein
MAAAIVMCGIDYQETGQNGTAQAKSAEKHCCSLRDSKR